jgi:hypothetical protein
LPESWITNYPLETARRLLKEGLPVLADKSEIESLPSLRLPSPPLSKKVAVQKYRENLKNI